MTIPDSLLKTSTQTIIALGFTAVFCLLAVRGDVSPDLFSQQVATIIAFFFGVKMATNGS